MTNGLLSIIIIGIILDNHYKLKVLNNKTDTIRVKLYIILLWLFEIGNTLAVIPKETTIRLLKSYFRRDGNFCEYIGE